MALLMLAPDMANPNVILETTKIRMLPLGNVEERVLDSCEHSQGHHPHVILLASSDGVPAPPDTAQFRCHIVLLALNQLCAMILTNLRTIANST